MYSIGDRLKDARMSKGLRVEDIENRTNVRVRYIKAIEEGDLDVLPGKSYARTFIKLYAEEVGFDGEQLAREFEDKHHKYFKKREAKQSKKNSRHKKTDNGNWETIQDSLPMIVVIVLIIAIIIAIYLGVKTLNSEPEEPIIQTGSAESMYIGEAPSEKLEDESKVHAQETLSIDFNERAGSTLDYQVEGNSAGNLELEVATEADTWTTIQVNGQEVGDQLLASGERINASIEEELNQVTLSLGNASEAVVRLNGEEVPFQDQADDVSSLTLVFNFE